LWKLYVNTNDIEALHAAALAAGATEDMAPLRMEQWPTSVSFVRDRDGFLVELVQRHPWQDVDEASPAWLGQYCVNVSDLDRTVAFYEALGLECTSRTSITDAEEAIVERPGMGGKIQLAQHADREGPIERGTVMRKLYLMTDDATATHAAGLAAGGEDLGAPAKPDGYPVTVAFVGDPDGYRVELISRD
jgi:catechol 2,3-dioxygenase-like lactoylglutathione lyase family enzyme